MLRQELNNVAAVVLAAGKGTRLNCNDRPKVMFEIGGKPMVNYIVETLKEIGFLKEQICLVIGFQGETVKNYFGETVSYALQEKQKGTAHAAYTGMKKLPDKIATVLVIGGDDSAFYHKETIADFIKQHMDSNCALSFLTAEADDPSQLGRIIRHKNGSVEIIEKEYADKEQKKIKEVNTGTFCFKRKWFEEMFVKMPPLSKLGEYGLPTALDMARKQNKKYQAIKLFNSEEWFGVNTTEELKKADRRKYATK